MAVTCGPAWRPSAPPGTEESGQGGRHLRPRLASVGPARYGSQDPVRDVPVSGPYAAQASALRPRLIVSWFS